jgi:hypothetical protein
MLMVITPDIPMINPRIDHWKHGCRTVYLYHHSFNRNYNAPSSDEPSKKRTPMKVILSAVLRPDRKLYNGPESHKLAITA